MLIFVAVGMWATLALSTYPQADPGRTRQAGTGQVHHVVPLHHEVTLIWKRYQATPRGRALHAERNPATVPDSSAARWIMV
jgi:hypothetical protein